MKSKKDKLDIDKSWPLPGITTLATKTTLDAKINEVISEIPNITNLATKTALNSVDSVSNLVTDYNTKLNKIGKEITDHNYDYYSRI